MFPNRKMQFVAIPITVQSIQHQIQQGVHLLVQPGVQTQIQPQVKLENQPRIQHETQPHIQLGVSHKTQPQQLPCNPLTPQLLPDSVANEILATQKRKKVTDSQSRELVIHVLKKCEEEYRKCALQLPLACVRARAANYTGISESTLGKLKVEDRKRKEMGQSEKPLLRLRRKRAFKTVLDDRDMIIIKNLIRDHYIKHCKVPVVRKLFPIIVDEIPTYGNNTSFLHKVLTHIGYLRKRYYSKRSILIEDPTIIANRDNYLITMKDLRKQTENVFYIYECVIDRSYTLHKTWAQKYGCNDALRDQNTFTFLCAASKRGFLNKSALLHKTDFDTNARDLGGRLTSEFFERWLKVHLIPHLPEHSVIIMEDAPHHNILIDKSISYHSTKQDMIEYLRKKQVVCDESMRRSELYKLIEKNTPKHKVFIADNILQQSGHKTMRLPPFMIDLSPTQHAMDKIQQRLFENEYTTAFNLQNVLEILEDFMLSITQEDWIEFFEKVKLLEEECWRKDGEFEEAVDKVLLNLRDCVDSGSEESDLNSDGEDTG